MGKDRLVYYNQQEGYQQLRRAYMTGPQSWEDEVVQDTLVFSIAVMECESRTCRHGRSCPVYGWGVSFGPGSGHNWQGTLDEKYPSYDVCGLLEGLQQAFVEVVNIVEEEPKIVRIRTTSKTLVEVMAWEHEIDPKVQKHFDKVSKLWRQMESQYRITMQLWLVDPGEVSDAEDLALAALYS